MDNQVELHDHNQGFDTHNTHSFAGKMNTYEVAALARFFSIKFKAC